MIFNSNSKLISVTDVYMQYSCDFHNVSAQTEILTVTRDWCKAPDDSQMMRYKWLDSLTIRKNIRMTPHIHSHELHFIIRKIATNNNCLHWKTNMFAQITCAAWICIFCMYKKNIHDCAKCIWIRSSLNEYYIWKYTFFTAKSFRSFMKCERRPAGYRLKFIQIQCVQHLLQMLHRLLLSTVDRSLLLVNRIVFERRHLCDISQWREFPMQQQTIRTNR